MPRPIVTQGLLYGAALRDETGVRRLVTWLLENEGKLSEFERVLLQWCLDIIARNAKSQGRLEWLDETQ